MELIEYKKIKDLNYRQYSKYLQEKYGLAPKAYFHLSKKDNHLVAGRVSRGKEGLQCHHICEDLVASLSDKRVAEANNMEYQQPENLCYANLLEHLYLHILIAEEQNESEDGTVLGNGGVNWIVLALNSIYSDPSNSWYSRKIENLEEKGLSYNYNNIITDNKDTYLALVNRYCTSAFIRSKLNKEPEDLARGLCHTCRADLNNLDIYNDIMREAKNTFLFDWNVGAFADLETYLKTNNSALIQICTGGGKTTTGLEYLRVHNYKALVLGPSNTIEASWTGNDSIDYMNYQTFMNCYKEIAWDKYQVIICDEAHHIKADRWGEGVRWAMENVDIKVIGLTATPTKEQLDGTDIEFAGRICLGLDLAEGIAQGNIHPFSYIQSIYKMSDVKGEFEKYGPVGTQLWDRLNIQLNKNPIEKILKDNMPTGIRKIIVFVQNMKDIDVAISSMKEYDENLELRVINSKLDQEHNRKAKQWFNNTNDRNIGLVTVNMVNEGAHYRGVNTLVMFRRTNSTTLYTQQLGRIVVTTKKQNPNGIVFDFTNNAQNLIYRSKSALSVEIKTNGEEPPVEPEGTLPGTLIDVLKKIVEENDGEKTIVEKNAGKEIIYKDYTEDCVQMLNALKDASNVNTTIRKVYTAFINTIEDGNELINLFDFEAWKEFKTNNKGTFVVKEKPKHAITTADKEEYEKKKAEGKIAPTIRGTVSISDAEKLATAFKLALRRSFNFGAIDFENSAKCKMIITDENAFEEIVSSVGFKNAVKFKAIVDKISVDSFTYAVNLD